jgi:glucokinase
MQQLGIVLLEFRVRLSKRRLRMNEPVFVGVDIGGTKVAAGLVNGAGEILFRTRVPMHSTGTAEAAAESVFAAIDAVMNAAQGTTVQGIGLSAPGPLDPRTGVIINPPNVTCWRNFPLAAIVKERYPYRVRVDNDGNAAGLAEALWGAGRGYSSVFYVTLGTGVGTGIIFDRKLYLGRTGAAGEGGHISIDYKGPVCGCGKHGCIEVLASGPAIARRARAKLEQSGRGEGLLVLCGGKPENVTSEMVAQAWKQGDRLATEVLRETAELLTIWLGNVIDLLDPDVIVFGGGLSAVMTQWFGEIRSLLPKWCINSRCTEIPLKPARFGAESGIIGAASLCFEESAEAAATHS